VSENPYEAPIPNIQAGINGSGALRSQKTLKTICIICIVLGSLGLMASLLGLVAILFQSQFAELQQNMAAPGQQAMQRKIIEAQSSFQIPNAIIGICNLIIAPMLLVGGIGVLRKKSWGQKLLSRGLISAAIFVLARAILTSFFQFQIFGVMKETMTANLPPGPQSGTMESVMTASLFFGFAMGFAMALALAAFYFWGWRYLKKDTCQQYLNTFTS